MRIEAKQLTKYATALAKVTVGSSRTLPALQMVRIGEDELRVTDLETTGTIRRAALRRK